jgi:hypothetical protein
MREQFDHGQFRAAGLETVAQANEIIADYQRQGLTLTVRQLYYRFVAKGLIPNTFRAYKNLASTIDLGRRRGMIDWAAIEDRTRNLEKPNAWESPEEIIAAVARQYKEDIWATQPRYVEVWVEKEALVGVIESACKELRVPFLACRGYLSQSEAYDAGKRFQKVSRQGCDPLIFHLGDHDPSGLDMTRDNADRVREYSRVDVEVIRLALNRDQIDQYDPPPNPAKESDSRFDAYREEHGDESWELDALEPSVLIELIQSAIQAQIDQDAWDAAIEVEQENTGSLADAAQDWSAVARYLKYRGEGVTDDDVEPTIEDRLVECEDRD